MTAEDWEAWCDATVPDDEPPGLDEEEEPELEAAPGERVWGPGGFARGGILDGLPGGIELAFFADAAAGDGDRYAGASDGELDGVIASWDRVEAHAAARKHAAVAEFIRRRPEKGCEPKDPGGMPERWDEFAADELRVLLAESKAVAERLLDRAQHLAARLPGTMAAFTSGKLRQSKVTIIADVTAPLDDEEAKAAKDARVERWAEDSGNAALMGRELPPDEVLAADQRITAWAHELRNGGLEGDMDRGTSPDHDRGLRPSLPGQRP